MFSLVLTQALLFSSFFIPLLAAQNPPPHLSIGAITIDATGGDARAKISFDVQDEATKLKASCKSNLTGFQTTYKNNDRRIPSFSIIQPWLSEDVVECGGRFSFLFNETTSTTARLVVQQSVSSTPRNYYGEWHIGSVRLPDINTWNRNDQRLFRTEVAAFETIIMPAIPNPAMTPSNTTDKSTGTYTSSLSNTILPRNTHLPRNTRLPRKPLHI